MSLVLPAECVPATGGTHAVMGKTSGLRSQQRLDTAGQRVGRRDGDNPGTAARTERKRMGDGRIRTRDRMHTECGKNSQRCGQNELEAKPTRQWMTTELTVLQTPKCRAGGSPWATLREAGEQREPTTTRPTTRPNMQGPAKEPDTTQASLCPPAPCRQASRACGAATLPSWLGEGRGGLVSLHSWPCCYSWV